MLLQIFMCTLSNYLRMQNMLQQVAMHTYDNMLSLYDCWCFLKQYYFLECGNVGWCHICKMHKYVAFTIGSNQHLYKYEVWYLRFRWHNVVAKYINHNNARLWHPEVSMRIGSTIYVMMPSLKLSSYVATVMGTFQTDSTTFLWYTCIRMFNRRHKIKGHLIWLPYLSSDCIFSCGIQSSMIWIMFVL